MSYLECPLNQVESFLPPTCPGETLFKSLTILVEIQSQLLTGTPFAPNYCHLLQRLQAVIAVTQINLAEKCFQPSPANSSSNQSPQWHLYQEPASNSPTIIADIQLPLPRPWLSALAGGEIIVAQVPELPPEEAQFFQPQGIVSVLVIPLVLAGELLGFISVQDSRPHFLETPMIPTLLQGVAYGILLNHQRLQTETNCQSTQRRLETIIETVAEGITLSDLKGNFEFFNAQMEGLTGYTREEVNNSDNFLARIYPVGSEEHHKAIAGIASVLETGIIHNQETTIQTKSGISKTLLVSTSLLQGSDYPRFLSIYRDITERKQMEAELRQSKLFIERILNVSPQMVYVYDLITHRTLYINHQVWEILGYTPITVQTQKSQWWLETLHPEDLALFLEKYPQLFLSLQEGEVVEAEYRQRHTNGGWRWLHSRSVIFTRTAAGLPEQIVITATDITERKQAAEALRRSEARLKIIIDNTSDGLLMIDRQGLIRFANPAAARLFNRSLDQLMNHEFGVPVVADETAELQIIKTDGSLGISEMSVAQIEGEDDSIYLVSIRDVTKRRQAEQALRESEAKFRQMVDHLHNVFWLLSPACDQFLYVSPAYEKIWGRSCQSLYENPGTWLEAIILEDRHKVIDAFTRQLQGQPTSIEYRILQPDGHIRWIWEQAFPIYDDFQRVYRIAGIAEDISERQKIQAELRGSEALYAGIFNHSTDGIFLINIHWSLSELTPAEDTALKQSPLDEHYPQFTYETVNPAYERVMGRSAAHVAGKTFPEVMTPDRVVQLERWCRSVILAGKPITYEESFTLGDELRMWRTCLVPIRNERGVIIKLQGSMRDITEEKQALAEQLHQTRYRALLTSIIVKIRQSLEIDEILNTTVVELRKILHADRVVIAELQSDHDLKILNESLVSDLSPMIGLLMPVPFPIPEDPGESKTLVIDVITSSGSSIGSDAWQTYQIQTALIVPIIGRGKWQLQAVTPGGSAAESHSPPQIQGFLWVQQCHRRRLWSASERELLQQLADQLSIALYQAQLLHRETQQRQELARSNAELEQFAYVASHDLQAPLQTIISYAKLLERRYSQELDEKAHQFIHFIIDGSDRMQHLIQDLLEYSRVGTRGQPFAWTDCQTVLDQALANLKALIDQSQALITTESLPKVIGDQSQLIQLFQNLIQNAIQYQRKNSQPRVRIQAVLHQESWLFSVQDNGIGVDPKYSQRIFEIFQRLHTQEEYTGTGIGLAVCQKIVARHGGRIWVTSQLGQGSTFYFTLPIAQDPSLA